MASKLPKPHQNLSSAPQGADSAVRHGITVAVPAFNVADYIIDCLNSLRSALTHMDELVIVDDGSTDATAEALSTWLSSHELPCPHHVVRTRNHGVAAARRLASTIASKEYIWFVDADDCVMATEVGRIRHILAEHHPDMLVFDHLEWQPTDNLTKACRHKSHTPLKIQSDPGLNVEETLLDGVVATWSRIVKRHLLVSSLNSIFPENCMYEDMASTPILVSKARTLIYSPTPLIMYRHNPNGLSKQLTCDTQRQFIYACTHLRTKLKEEWQNHAQVNTALNLYLMRKRYELERSVRKSRDRSLSLDVGARLITADIHATDLIASFKLAIRSKRAVNIKACIQAGIDIFLNPDVRDSKRSL